MATKHTNIFKFSARSCLELPKCEQVDSEIKIPLSNQSQRLGAGVGLGGFA
jgi:hypothetical protein